MVISIVFLPLLGVLFAGIFGDYVNRSVVQFTTAILQLIGAVLAWLVFIKVGFDHENYRAILANWINSGDFHVTWALKVDTLTAVMLVVVTTVSAVVQFYSIGYMSEESDVARFHSYLSLFTLMMLLLVTADNFLQLFFGWEGVGLASYLLIGFWYHKPSANAAAIKAFVINRVGDFGLLIAIFTIFVIFGSVTFDDVFAKAALVAGQHFHFWGMDLDILTVICLLLFVGCMGKSAQLGLHTWLPDAMEGPTPVSALIHAATMVTAGVFLIARCSPLFSLAPIALDVVTIIGASTAFFAATIALVQNDIKRVVAYSTCSQLGYMFFAAGVGAYDVAIFHLFTHAFFKALLFLSAGSVITAMHHEQDMRNMGALGGRIKITCLMMWIGSLALAGLPFLSGYYSKDLIIEVAYAAGSGIGFYAFWLGVAAALLTAFYSWRLLIMTFHGKSRVDHHILEHAHESPLIMLLPMAVLAMGAIFAGFLFSPFFVGAGRESFWNGAVVLQTNGKDIIEIAHHAVPSFMKIFPTIMAVLGIVIAFAMYIAYPTWPKRMAESMQRLYQALLNQWYFDRIYDAIFVRSALKFGELFWKIGDGILIDNRCVGGLTRRVLNATNLVVKMQTGYIYHYAFAMLLGLVCFAAWHIYWVVTL